jgi:putative aminopeptidase FrvX
MPAQICPAIWNRVGVSACVCVLPRRHAGEHRCFCYLTTKEGVSCRATRTVARSG